MQTKRATDFKVTQKPVSPRIFSYKSLRPCGRAKGASAWHQTELRALDVQKILLVITLSPCASPAREKQPGLCLFLSCVWCILGTRSFL